MPNRKRTHKKHRRRITKKRGGGCGCNASASPGPRFLGGSAYLNQVPQYAYYPYNSDLKNDMTDPINVHSTRFMGDFSRTGGGKRRRSRRQRKMRGGMNFFTNLYNQLQATGSNMNYITATGSVNAINNQANLAAGLNQPVNSSVLSQPVITQPYGWSNPPLV